MNAPNAIRMDRTYKELTLVRVLTRIGHTDHSLLIMLPCQVFIIESTAMIYGTITSCSVESFKVTCLTHEIGYDPMKLTPTIGCHRSPKTSPFIIRAQGHKVTTGFRTGFFMQPNDNCFWLDLTGYGDFQVTKVREVCGIVGCLNL